MSRYRVGIDLGTTNIAVAYVDTREKSATPRLQPFRIPQVVAAGQVDAKDLLPSFLYLPGPHDLPPGSIGLPWNSDAAEIVGHFARSHGAKIPGRQVSSAKSWLCHPGVDRTAPLLPWSAPPEVPRLSPLDVSAKYLRHIVDAWNHSHKADPLEDQHVVITVPASFDDVARNLTAEAAKKAGFKHLTLLEEPQAAFYAWLGTHNPAEATKLKPGMRCLVIDVGGGTSDFSLIRVAEGQGDLAFERDAVGEHLLLGGDNMDLALAKAVETKLNSRIDAAQFGGLVQACRNAKEILLSASPPPSYPVTVVGRGRSVVGGTISVPITAEDVKQAIFDGFFPAAAKADRPARGNRSGLQEMGLPYVADAAVTKHLAAFVQEHVPDGSTIDAILFNGGVFQPAALQQRLIDVMTPWFGNAWKPLVLTSPSLDLAVAWGAAYYCWLKHSGGRRIGGGIPRSYYIGLGDGNVLCVVPRKLQEGEHLELKEPVLQLSIGQPVAFPLFTSTVRGDDQPGQILQLNDQQLLPLPPLHTSLRGGKRAGVKDVPVTLEAKCTEIGTLELACVNREGTRWKLEFNVRDVRRDDEPATVVDVWPEERIQAAGAAIRDVFAGKGSPQDLPKQLETALECGRNEWPTGVCRRVWEFLDEHAEGRTRGPQHLARWYNLAGFVLRPGFGDPLDKYRVDNLWKLLSSAAAKGGTPEGGADYWILWRRVAGGLNGGLQQSLFTKLRPVVLPGKSVAKPAANELAEMWRCAASLERLDLKTRESLGHQLLLQLDRCPNYLFWSLTRLGGRVPLYGPLNSLAHVQTVEAWLETLLAYQPNHDTDRLGWAFCLSQLARRSGLRAIDVNEELRDRVLTVLTAQTVPAAWPAMVSDVTTDRDGESRLFGDTLPLGLRLV